MHLHLPRQLSVPFVLLSVVYAAAITVALTDPGRPTVAGLVVLAGLTARWVAHHRRAPATSGVAAVTALDAVLPDAEPASSPAVAA